MTGANAFVSKKPFGIDLDYLLVAVLFLLVIFSAKGFALSVTAPESVTINDKASFYVDITNDSIQGIDFEVSIFAPVKTQIVSPTSIGPNETAKAKIIVYNKYSEKTEINSKIEVISEGIIVQKEITFIFEPANETAIPQGESRILTGLFSFGLVLGELTGFTILDWVIFWILVVIVAFLLIAFVARLRKRV